jgi:phage shock protein C
MDMQTQTRLTRSTSDKVIGGVCSGIAHYFGIDPVIVRLLAVALVFAGGISILLYPVLWLIMPTAYSTSSSASESWQEMQQFGQQVKGQVQGAFGGTAQPRYDAQTGQPLATPMNRNRLAGAILLGIGVLLRQGN